MPKTTPFKNLTKNWSAARRARVAALKQEYEGEMVLEQLRESLERTQEELAEKLNTSQANISKLEDRADMLLSTLRRYVRALGGDLEICAKLPGLGSIRLKGLGELRPRNQ